MIGHRRHMASEMWLLYELDGPGPHVLLAFPTLSTSLGVRDLRILSLNPATTLPSRISNNVKIGKPL